MNILYLINYLGGGGTENYIYSLVREYSKDNNIYLVYSQKGEGYDKFSRLDIELIQMDMDSSFDFKAAKKLRDICRDKDIDLVHTNFLRENYISILSKILGARIKLVNTRHMLDENTGFIKFVNRQMTRFNDTIIAVSQAVEELLYRELGKRSNIELVYTGLDLDYWSKSPDRGIKEELNLGEELIVTSVSRFSKEKGNEFLIDTIEDLIVKNKLSSDSIKFLLVGGGSDLDRIKALVSEKDIDDYIIFTGYRDDIREILNISDIFVLPSKKEAFGISILEAMAMELPVVATKVGGIVEIITSDSYGLTVDYGDLASFSSSIYSLIASDELRRRLGTNSRDYIKENFNIEGTLSRTMDLYK